jgi:phage terminase Nu1 subunit (DNA packaging protein)
LALANRPALLTQAAIALAFKKSRETIRLWEKAGMPSRKGGFVLADCIEWREEVVRQESLRPEEVDEAKERARKMRADADLSELKVQQMRAELIPASKVEQDMERLCAMVRARVLAVRGRWAPKIIRLDTMAAATAVLDALAADVLDALRDGADDLEDDVSDTEEAA